MSFMAKVDRFTYLELKVYRRNLANDLAMALLKVPKSPDTADNFSRWCEDTAHGITERLAARELAEKDARAE